MPTQAEKERPASDAAAHSGAVESGSQKAPAKNRVATQIFGWTNNLIATAVVIIIALAVGTQLIDWWRPAAKSASSQPTIVDSWSTIEKCALVFGDSPHQLIHEQTTGDIDDAYAFLTKQIVAILETSPNPVGAAGAEEQQMLASTRDLTPRAERAGAWRLFRVQDPLGRGLPTVIGVRDDCDITEQNDQRSRMTVWGIAMSNAEKEWTTFTSFAASEGNRSVLSGTQPGEQQFKLPIPPAASRTVSLSNPQSDSTLVGFTGGQLPDAIAYYQRWAVDNGWTFNTSNSSPQNKTKWQQTFLPPKNSESELGGIQVILTVETDGQLRGLLMLQPKLTRLNTKLKN